MVGPDVAARHQQVEEMRRNWRDNSVGRAPVALPKDLGSVASTHVVKHLCNSGCRDPPPLASVGASRV